MDLWIVRILASLSLLLPFAVQATNGDRDMSPPAKKPCTTDLRTPETQNLVRHWYTLDVGDTEHKELVTIVLAKTLTPAEGAKLTQQLKNILTPLKSTNPAGADLLKKFIIHTTAEASFGETAEHYIAAIAFFEKFMAQHPNLGHDFERLSADLNKLVSITSSTDPYFFYMKWDVLSAFLVKNNQIACSIKNCDLPYLPPALNKLSSKLRALHLQNVSLPYLVLLSARFAQLNKLELENVPNAALLLSNINSQIHHLTVRNCNMAKLRDLDTTNLVHLDLSHNQLTRIPKLPQQLATLIVKNNDLIDMSALATATNLNTLDITANPRLETLNQLPRKHYKKLTYDPHHTLPEDVTTDTASHTPLGLPPVITLKIPSKTPPHEELAFNTLSDEMGQLKHIVTTKPSKFVATWNHLWACKHFASDRFKAYIMNYGAQNLPEDKLRDLQSGLQSIQVFPPLSETPSTSPVIIAVETREHQQTLAETANAL